MLLDEPLANLDRRLRDIMRLELKKLQEKVGITTLYVTHDQEEALTMADRIVVMHKGDMLQIGTPSEVYNNPRTPFVSKFLGETSQFEGVVRSVDQSVLTIDLNGGGTVLAPATPGCDGGQAISVSIRPERIHLSRQRPESGVNIWRGTIDFVSYYGSHVVYLIRLDDGHGLLRASEPLPAGQASYAQGEVVFATWQFDQIVCVRA